MSNIRLPKRPNMRFETELASQGFTRICGVDEAGRGPLAGPVVACAVILPKTGIPRGLNDSKVLSQEKRERLYTAIRARCLVGIGMAEPEEIDRINILGASLMAMRRAVLALPRSPDHQWPDHALIDGNRRADLQFSQTLTIPQTLIIKGDARSRSIAAASIVAKVTRDRIMVEADARFAGYNLTANKGYPTKAHRDAVAKIGACPIHRRSFAPIKAWYC